MTARELSESCVMGNRYRVSEDPAFQARAVTLRAAELSLAEEVLEVHGRFTVAEQITMTGHTNTRAFKAGVRSMVAVRSFLGGHAGFSYTTDISSMGINRAICAARSARTLALDSPIPGLPTEDDGRWEDRSAALSQLEAMWVAQATEAELVLRKSRTTVIHARSDNAHAEYSEGSTSAIVSRGPRTEAIWSRELNAEHLQNLLEYTSTGQEKPWSLAHHPIIFLGAAGAALTAIILRGLVGPSPHLAKKIASRLPNGLYVIDDAADSLGPAGGPFDGEGWPTLRRTLAERGELAVEPTLWGCPSRTSGPHGLSWRRDLARPPVLAPSNVMLVARPLMESNASGSQAWIAKLNRGLVCDSVTAGALSLDLQTGSFAVPCTGRLVRSGEVTERRVRGMLQGSVDELAAGIVDVSPASGYTPLDCGVHNADIFVVHGIALQSM